jgi:hypothetical protein
VVLIGGGIWMFRDQHAPAAPQAVLVAPPLPAGRLEFLTTSVSDALLLAADETRSAGDSRAATVLVIGKSPTAIAKRYAMMTRRETIDCRQGRIFNEMAGEYDAKGALLNSELQSGPAGRPVEASDAEVQRLCPDKPPAPRRTVIGYRAAQREVQTPPDDLYATATANPQDADAWAWVCASGARGHWRPSMPRDCDHAVSLQPKSTATILDRGFLKLITGHRPDANADFGKALAIEPGNGVALFGRSLVSAMDGDLAASRRDRTKALAMDPTAPDWIEANYRFQIADKYRK